MVLNQQKTIGVTGRQLVQVYLRTGTETGSLAPSFNMKLDDPSNEQVLHKLKEAQAKS